ncbi:MAG TPA: hypothetical protein VMT38_00490 [Terracidiphilus sp.]|nr:hypothetical protein [Terracidiphilus sp.]
MARNYDDLRLVILPDELFKSSQLIAEKARIHQQYVGMVPNGLGEAMRIFAFGQNPNVTLAGDRTAHPQQRKWLIVRENNINFGHLFCSPMLKLPAAPYVWLRNQNEFQNDE